MMPKVEATTDSPMSVMFALHLRLFWLPNSLLNPDDNH